MIEDLAGPSLAKLHLVGLSSWEQPTLTLIRRGSRAVYIAWYSVCGLLWWGYLG